jgi:hypothetical protein
MEGLRWGIVAAAMTTIVGSLLVSLELPDDLVFIALVAMVAAVPYVLYAAFTVGPVASVVFGALLFVPTAGMFLAAAIEVVEERQGGAGGMLAWICLPLLVVDWGIALFGILVSRAGARPHHQRL